MFVNDGNLLQKLIGSKAKLNFFNNRFKITVVLSKSNILQYIFLVGPDHKIAAFFKLCNLKIYFPVHSNS